MDVVLSNVIQNIIMDLFQLNREKVILMSNSYKLSVVIGIEDDV